MVAKTAMKFLCVVLVVSTWIGLSSVVVSAQSPICELLETRYSILVGDWIWIDSRTVVFEVAGTEYDASGFNLVSVQVWYRYDVESTTLTELAAPPTVLPGGVAGSTLSRITGIPASDPELLALVDASPSTNAFVYPRIDAVNDRYEYWYTDASTGARVDLGLSIPTPAFRYEAVWSAQASRFVLQSSFYNLVDVPTVYVTFENDTAEVTLLRDVQAFNQVIPPNAGYNVMGLSADGRYLVIDPQFPPYQMKIFDWQERAWIDLPFLAQGRRRAIVWSSPYEFIAITDSGVVRYNIDTAAVEMITSPSDLGTVIHGDLSPTGSYITGIWQTIENEHTVETIAVCRLS